MQNREQSVLLLLQLFAQDKEIISRNRSERKGEGEVKTRVKSVWEWQVQHSMLKQDLKKSEWPEN